MAIFISCDGCGEPVSQDAVKEEGYYDKAQFCPVCHPRFLDWEKKIQEKRAEVVEGFETWLKEHREEATKDGLFKRLPDGQ